MKINNIQELKRYVNHKKQFFITDNFSLEHYYTIDIYNVVYCNIRKNYVSFQFKNEKQLYELELENMEAEHLVCSLFNNEMKSGFNLKVIKK